MLERGIYPEVEHSDWRLKLHGLVEHPVTLDWTQLMGVEEFADASDFHCVTTWSQFDIKREGVSSFTLAELVKLKVEVTHVFYKSHDGIPTWCRDGRRCPRGSHVEWGTGAR